MPLGLNELSKWYSTMIQYKFWWLFFLLLCTWSTYDNVLPIEPVCQYVRLFICSHWTRVGHGDLASWGDKQHHSRWSCTQCRRCLLRFFASQEAEMNGLVDREDFWVEDGGRKVSMEWGKSPVPGLAQGFYLITWWLCWGFLRIKRGKKTYINCWTVRR